MSLLRIDNLQTHFFTSAGVVKAVDGVSYSVERGEVLAVVGESGSGKSVTGLSVMGLIEPPGRIAGGSVHFDGQNITNLPQNEMRRLRGSRISMIFQDPMMTLNPLLRVETQMIETIRAHRSMPKDEAWALCRDTLGRVGIPSPNERMRAYPHQFSGGMRQRVAIAIALLNKPDLIIADEPTTALDVTIQAQILHLMQQLVEEDRTALVWITHDLSVVAGFADRVAVMYAGEIVEQATTDGLITTPQHPYSRGLIGSVPSRNVRGTRLNQIPGGAPSALNRPEGCRFASRCDYRKEGCQVAQVLSDNVRCWRVNELPDFVEVPA